MMSGKISPGSVDNTHIYCTDSQSQALWKLSVGLYVNQEITVCNHHLIIFSLCGINTVYYNRTLVTLTHEQDQQVTNRTLDYIIYICKLPMSAQQKGREKQKYF